MKTRAFRRTLTWLCGAALLANLSHLAAQQQCNVTWTLDEDFDDGVAINLGTGDGGELVLNTFTTPLPFVYVACSGRGTAVRIDVNTGAILGEYLTAPNGMGRNPSRTTVDKFGNVWVANRDEAGFSGGENKGSITRIGVIIGGVRGNKNGDGTFTDDPNGQYLRPPFLYSTVTDRDGDGYIKTSKGLGNILGWSNAGGANTHGGVSTAEDEAIINYTRVAGTLTRTVAVDGNNDVWTSGTGDRDHEKISGATGLPVPGTRFNAGCGGYGGLVDGNNVLWSARGAGEQLLRYDANTPVPPNAGSIWNCYPPATHGDYGLGIDPTTGNIWHSSLSGNQIRVISPAGAVLGTFGHGNWWAQGVAVDASGNVWVAHSLIAGYTTVGHVRTNGLWVGNVTLPGGSGPTGVAVDANGKVWVTNYYTNNVQRIDPNAGPIGNGGFPVGAVDLTVGLGAGASPYNYSDMTGFVSLGSSTPSGTWAVVKDGGVDDGEWGMLTWIGSEPAGTDIKVEVRASNTQIGLAAETFVEVGSGVSFCDLGITGRFIEIRVTLSRSSGNDTPELHELVLGCCNEPPVAVCRDITVETDETCMATVEPGQVDNGSYDPDGEPEWQMDLSMSPAGPFGLGEHEVTLTITDADGATDECTATITVVDATAPTLEMSTVTINPWPANHNYTTVSIEDIVASVSDACDGELSLTDVIITSVTSDEPEDANGNGDGSTLNDIVIAADCQSVDLRMERNGTGNGRVYRIHVAVTDAGGNTSASSFPVGVRRNNGADEVAVEDAVSYEVLGTCGGAGKFVTGGGAAALGNVLGQNIPNPFTGMTEIPFTLASPGRATLSVFDARGKRLATVLDEQRPAGSQSAAFDGSALVAGIYYCVLESAGVKLVRTLVIAR